MGFGYRKSKKLGGGFRLNLSKSGLGLSGGFEGFRIFANSKGTNLSVGKKGIYYRKKISSNKQNVDNVSKNGNIGNSFLKWGFICGCIGVIGMCINDFFVLFLLPAVFFLFFGVLIALLNLFKSVARGEDEE